jgi:hypothetical protein
MHYKHMIVVRYNMNIMITIGSHKKQRTSIQFSNYQLQKIRAQVKDRKLIIDNHWHNIFFEKVMIIYSNGFPPTNKYR